MLLTCRLIENDILVVVTGCAAVANGKAGQMVPEEAEQAGQGLKAVCKALRIPPVLHMGSWVDNSRILALAAALAVHLVVDLADYFMTGGGENFSGKGRDVCSRLGIEHHGNMRVKTVLSARKEVLLDDGDVTDGKAVRRCARSS